MGHAESSGSIDDAAPGITVDEVISSFDDLTTLAPVAVEVLRIADDETASMTDLVSAINHDPALAARVLRIANSAFYSSGAEVTSLLRAATLLGLTTVKMLALGFNLRSSLSTDQLDSARLWRSSLTTSIVGSHLARVRMPERADEVFVAGLLSDIGKFALARVPAYVERLTEAGGRLRPDDERALLGFTSDEVTAAMLANWGLPARIGDAVRYRSEVVGVPADVAETAAVLGVATDAARFLLTADVEQAVTLVELQLSAASRLGLTEREIEDVLTHATVDANDVAVVFELDEITATPVTDLLVAAQSKMARLSLELAAMLGDQRARTAELSEANEQLQIEVSTDPVTGLPNRRMYQSFIDYQVASHHRRPRATTLALVLLDIDHFKSVNDRHGHAVGDEVLAEIGARLARTTRRTELTARLGGDEFALVLPDAVHADIPRAVERLHRVVSDEPIATAVGPLTVTVSSGAAVLDHSLASDAGPLYAEADRALYRSKALGRNRATTASRH